MPAHRIFLSHLRSLAPRPGEIVSFEGDEARHALRVKRLRLGEAVELLDGAGFIARGELACDSAPSSAPPPAPPKPRHRDEALCHIRIIELIELPRTRPIVHVCSAVPKGSRIDDMIDALTQAGAASWCPLLTARLVSGPHDIKHGRLQRIVIEACKQSGRPWLMDLGPARTIPQITKTGATAIIADASGTRPDLRAQASDMPIYLLIGPEGGWTHDELHAARAAGAVVACFGPHVMRIETAAVVAAAILMAPR